LTTSAFFSKRKLRHLLRPGTIDTSSGPSGDAHLMANEVVGAASRFIISDRPNLVFVHIGEPDYAGHRFGWMTLPYGWAVRQADAAVGRLLAAAEEAYGPGMYSVIVTADHGGQGHGHGSGSDVARRIPWIAWGAGVQRGVVARQVKTMDTAATVLWLLGVEQPTAWASRAVTPAYNAAARLAGAAGQLDDAQTRGRGRAGLAPDRGS
jgi:bisphosphoglycerate-independent phosphoglycerate mutase (AlkP superfamily)